MVTLRAYAAGAPGPEHFAVEDGVAPTPAPGQALCRTIFISLDPYVRLSLLPPDSDVPGARAMRIGDVVEGRGVSEVVESRIAGLEPGDVVASGTGWQAYSLVDEGGYRHVDDVAPPSAALGVLGMPGFTAWAGLRFAGAATPGQTVVVSAASGAVGSVVVQLARRWGCTAVGIAGSDEKCRWVRDELRANACVSHHTSDLRRELSLACPQGIDVYFDNVGGDVLAAVLPNLNLHATVVVCGRISHLNENEGDQRGADRMPTLLGSILTRRLTVRGFAWTEFADHWDEFVAELAPLVEHGDIRYREDVVDGLEEVPYAYSRLFDGTNHGKLVVRVHAPT